MKTETLERANELQKQIVWYKKHIADIKLIDSKGGYQCMTLKPEDSYYFDGRELLPELLPISLNDFKSLYISKAEAKIKELEAEFEALKD